MLFIRPTQQGVEAPAFMRGKERFSAPEALSAPIMRFSAGGLEHLIQE
jgi:hypothetical protein